MADQTLIEDKYVAAALRLAAERPWSAVTLSDIAEAAGSNLVELRRAFPSKGAILAAFVRTVDDAVLSRAAKPAPTQPARDRLFDVVMTRLDVLQPFKPALKSIAATRPFDLELMRKACASQAWMLAAAGIPADGPLGPLRVAGLGTLYGSVFKTWLDDDGPDHARTMAALDRRLKRGEQALTTVTDICSGVSGVIDRLRGRAKPAEAAPASDNEPGGTTGPLGYGRG